MIVLDYLISGIFGSLVDKTGVNIVFSIKFWSTSKKKNHSKQTFLYHFMAHLSSRLWSLYVSECQDICVIIQITFQTHFKFSETLHHLNPKSLRSDGCMGINIDLVMFRRGREKWRGRNYSAICKPTITKIFPCGVLSCVDMYFLVWLLECHFPYSSKTLTVLLGLL